MRAHGTKARDVSDVGHDLCSYLVGNLTDNLEVYGPGVAGGAHHYELRLVLSGNGRHLGVVEHLCLGRDAVRHDFVHLAREVNRAAVREVAAVGQVHAHDGVAKFEHGKVSGHVGLRAAHRLHIDMLCAGKELLAALASQILCHVHTSRAAVVAFAWVAFRILVSHDAALGFHDGSTCEVLRGDQTYVISLPLQLSLDRGCEEMQ